MSTLFATDKGRTSGFEVYVVKRYEITNALFMSVVYHKRVQYGAGFDNWHVWITVTQSRVKSILQHCNFEIWSIRWTVNVYVCGKCMRRVIRSLGNIRHNNLQSFLFVCQCILMVYTYTFFSCNPFFSICLFATDCMFSIAVISCICHNSGSSNPRFGPWTTAKRNFRRLQNAMEKII